MILKLAVAAGMVLIAGWLLSWLMPQRPRQPNRKEPPQELDACPRCGTFVPKGMCNCEREKR